MQEALLHASGNIRAFHQVQMPKGEALEVEKGVRLSRKIVPIDRVGLSIPGGTAPLFSTVLMLSIPAHVAVLGTGSKRQPRTTRQTKSEPKPIAKGNLENEEGHFSGHQ